jgi:hypothetical protein
MLRSLKALERYTVHALDGDIGSAVDFLLDDQRWAVRYLVVKTGTFPRSSQVLLSPISFGEVDWSRHRFNVELTMAKVMASPGAEVDQPVYRHQERAHLRYYGYPYYWGGSGLWGVGSYPGMIAADTWAPGIDDEDDDPGDLHLRSAREVRGYHIQGTDSAIGHVVDFVVDDETWEIHYLAIDTSNWWLGKKVLIAPSWAQRIDWDEQKVYVDLSRETIKDSPEWNENEGVNREYEARLYDYYGRPVYWASEGIPASHPAHSPAALF